ncbi:hypothetical protein [Sphingomonas immobilis]|uniref:Uncharacterized protein n=1 Tax=Sphingomonas immobilis TaxID=3063997 RepID=A0ABT8ZU20_9SPHN|nr:hypothetical protein [Sphingomonas sp. CA1-15]MDO7841065.1 hypothetical protein [Sphingomonas sp. CA1-15]
MAASDEAPVWLQQIIGVAAFVGTAGTAIWAGRKSKKEEPAAGSATVVAASFVGNRQMDDITTALTGLHATLIEVCGHLAAINERAHEEEIIREVVGKLSTLAAERGAASPELMALLKQLNA